MADTKHICVVSGVLFRFLENEGRFEEYGPIRSTIIATLSKHPVYKLGCYNDSSEYLCIATIAASNEAGIQITLQEGNYVSFIDDVRQCWSIQFSTVDEAIEFCGHVVVAMYGVAGQPNRGIIACDVFQGNEDVTVFANNRVKVKYQSWVVQSYGEHLLPPKLGSKLDGNLHDKPLSFTVPVNHFCVSPTMKGFEGMTIGMHEGGCRLLIIPVGAKRGAGPAVSMCFYVEVRRKKEDELEGNIGDGETNALIVAQPSCGASLLPANPRSSTSDAHAGVPSAASGFNREQFILVRRLSDQVSALTEQLREARQQLHAFGNDLRSHERKSRPRSLLDAQIELSVGKLLVEAAQHKDLLDQKDTALHRMNERCNAMENKLTKLVATTQLLEDEKRDSLTLASEGVLDLDRQLSSLQTELCRVQEERQDVARHLSTLKSLLEASDDRVKDDRRQLQAAIRDCQVRESKVEVTQGAVLEEVARQKLLDNTVLVLEEELKSLTETRRLKSELIEDWRRKYDAAMHLYGQLLENERGQSASELQDLRRVLHEELTARDRRYREERNRVAQMALERGRLRGIEGGRAEVLLEGDRVIHELEVQHQRNRAEAEALQLRYRGVHEQNEVYEEKANAQVCELQQTVDELQLLNSQDMAELVTLKETLRTAERRTYEELRHAMLPLTSPINQRDLLELVHRVAANQPIDYVFQRQRTVEDEKRVTEDREAVRAWVRARAYNQQASAPPLRPQFEVDLPLPQSANFCGWRASTTGSNQEAVERRYQEIYEQFAFMHSSLRTC